MPPMLYWIGVNQSYALPMPFARLVWANSSIPAPAGGVSSNSIYSNLHHVLTVKKQYPRDQIDEEIVPWILWRL